MNRIFTDAELQVMSKDAHELAVSKGFWDVRSIADPTESLLLIVTELAEAYQEFRKVELFPGTIYFHSIYDGGLMPWQENDHRHGPSSGSKPEGFPVEAADAYLRILDLLGALGLSPEPVDLSSEPEAKLPVAKHLWRLIKFVQGAEEEGAETRARWLSLSLAALEMMCHDVGCDLREAVMLKHGYNRGREYLHGKRC